MLASYLVYIISLYFLPGLALAQIAGGKIKKNPLFYLFLSFMATPLIYTGLAHLKIVQFNFFLLAVATLTGLLYSLRRSFKQSVDFDQILPTTELGRFLIVFALVFWLMNVLPRVGLLKSEYPIGDDAHRLGKTVAVAESLDFPLFYHFPTTRLTIYYFVTVGAGLLTKFSHNLIPVNVAWFVHVSLWTAAMLYFLVLSAGILFKSRLARLVFFLSLTFFSGYEFFVAAAGGFRPFREAGWTDLEWWTDWFPRVFNIHFQISSPYTLFFWVPQHLFAGLLGLLVFLIIRSEQARKPVAQIFLGLVFSSILGYSAFVFITIAFSYALFETFSLLKGKKTLRELILTNRLTGLAFLVFSVDTLRLFLGSEKTEWFAVRLNVFWFLTNTTFINKAVNLLLTVPLLLTIELGSLAWVLIYSIRRLMRGERETDLIFWHLNILLPFSAMFFVRAADDNNVSLRATIPALIGLAYFAGRLAEAIEKKKSLIALGGFLFCLSLPTTFFMFGQRLNEQKTFSQQRLNPIYKSIDRLTPLNSIILRDGGQGSDWTDISTLAHRFTFKPPSEFYVTDKEYSAASPLKKYEKFKSQTLAEIRQFVANVTTDQPWLKSYHFFLLAKENHPLPVVIEQPDYHLYSLDVAPEPQP